MRAIGYIGVCLLGIGALAGGCAGPSGQVDTGVISVGRAIASPEELKASDYFREIRYVPLETTDDCLIGEAPDVKLIHASYSEYVVAHATPDYNSGIYLRAPPVSSFS